MRNSVVTLNAGDLVTRTDLVAEYGGSVQAGGIVASTSSNTVFVFTDPHEGTQFGYVYDGFSADGSVFFYTGAGQDGDQKLEGSNSPLATHMKKGRSLHVFSAAGKVDGGSAKWQRYVGEFVLDPGNPYDRMPALDKRKALRTVIVFRLLPISSIPAEMLDEVGRSEISGKANTLEVPLEVNSNQFFETAGSKASSAVRRESQLVDEFVATLPNHKFTRWAITVPEENTRLLTDIYDHEDRTLYEAKAISSRSELRMALGQLYDYRRHIEVRDLHCAVLLPERPSNDLVGFLHSAGLGVTYRAPTGFETSSPNAIFSS